MRTRKSVEEVCNEVQKFLLENYLFGYDENEFGKESSLLELGVLDSTGIMELVSFIERQFGIEVLDREILPDNLDSIFKISRYVYEKMNDTAEG